jgi:hypothetical protein
MKLNFINQEIMSTFNKLPSLYMQGCNNGCPAQNLFRFLHGKKLRVSELKSSPKIISFKKIQQRVAVNVSMKSALHNPHLYLYFRRLKMV